MVSLSENNSNKCNTPPHHFLSFSSFLTNFSGSESNNTCSSQDSQSMSSSIFFSTFIHSLCNVYIINTSYTFFSSETSLSLPLDRNSNYQNQNEKDNIPEHFFSEFSFFSNLNEISDFSSNNSVPFADAVDFAASRYSSTKSFVTPYIRVLHVFTLFGSPPLPPLLPPDSCFFYLEPNLQFSSLSLN
jgi:hypothetical protein